jgi:hypothetical protein
MTKHMESGRSGHYQTRHTTAAQPRPAPKPPSSS